MLDEFEESAGNTVPVGDGDVSSRQRFAIARLVSRMYRAANGAMRADMLAGLLRPLGILSLVAVASGAFARLLRRDGVVPDAISTEDIVRYSSDQILELTLFVHEVSPEALQQLAEQLAQNATGMTALSAAALVLLHRKLRPNVGSSVISATPPRRGVD